MSGVTDVFLRLTGGRILILAVAIVIFLILVLIITIIFERKLIKKLTKKELSEKTKFEREIAALRKSRAPPEKIFASIDKSARDFLSKRYNINKNVDYSEIMRIFTKKKNKAIEGFSKNMLESIYSGRKIDGKTIKILLKELQSIVSRSGRGIPVKKGPSRGLRGLAKYYPKLKKSMVRREREVVSIPEEAGEPEGEEYEKELMNSKAMVMINKLQLQRNVLERAFEEGYIKKESYEISLHNINILSQKLKEKYL